MSVMQRFTSWGREMGRRARAIVSVWANPVVVRDMRVRMRGPRSYWHLALYLGVLGALSLAGYADATSGSHNAVQVQGQLQGLYYFIFVTLAALVCFIAPAITASSLTTERQRLTMDLLVTTPLTSSELLVGKLVSSIAFLGLLLVMSLPASALCVILGGATRGDVFVAYLLLAIDGLVLSAIGLYFSCVSKSSMNAVVTTYITIGLALFLSSSLAPVAMSGRMTGSGTANPAMAVAALNPFVAVTGSFSGTFPLAGLSIPLWLVTALCAFLAIRLLVTGATYRMGSYGTDAIGSLRRQLLFLTGVSGFLVVYGIFSSMGIPSGGTVAAFGSSAAILPGVVEYTMTAALAAALLFFPALFTPETTENAAPGEPVDGAYDIRRAFRPVHAGALPYFHLWVGALTAGVFLAALYGGALRPGLTGPVLFRLALSALYLSGAGTLCWGLARRVATLVPGLAAARALTFGTEVALVAAPIMLMVMFEKMTDPTESALAPLWIFYPVFQPEPKDAPTALVVTTVLTYAASVLAYPFWKKVVTAGVRYWGAKSAA